MAFNGQNRNFHSNSIDELDDPFTNDNDWDNSNIYG